MKNYKLKTFNEFMRLNEAGGQEAGKYELIDISVEDAINYAQEINVLELIPNFKKNFKFAQELAKKGQTERKDMPVITDTDIKKLQYKLKGGYIDVNPPYADDTDTADPFPEGLTGKDATEFLNRGLKDGSKGDDIVKIYKKKIRVGDLKPIQKQIYIDKSLKSIAEFGIDASIKFFTEKTTFLTSKDNYIIDGHHRFFGAVLINPDLKVNCLIIDLPMNKLVPLTLAYGDAIGNKRNL